MSGHIHAKIIEKFYHKTKYWCHRAVIEGYQKMTLKGKNYVEYEEEDISKELILEMVELKFVKEKQITITPEFPLYGAVFTQKTDNAKSADIIDFRFSKWKLKKELIYFGEAKNLSFKNWTKNKNKTPLNASSYRGRYIDTGITNLLSGKYSLLNGFLIGYIVNGKVTENIEALNNLIKKRKIQPQIGLIENQKPIHSYPYCYTSLNLMEEKNKSLQHIFIAFTSE